MKSQLKQTLRNLRDLKHAILTDALPMPLEPMSDARLDAKCSVEALIDLLDEQIEYLEIREEDEV